MERRKSSNHEGEEETTGRPDKSGKMEKSALAAASPIEEQPLIPKRYLEQKKLEKEKDLMTSEEEASSGQNEEVKRWSAEENERKEAERRLTEAEDRKEVERRLRSFKQISENVYLCSRKISKQFRNMQCDCDLSRASIALTC